MHQSIGGRDTGVQDPFLSDAGSRKSKHSVNTEDKIRRKEENLHRDEAAFG